MFLPLSVFVNDALNVYSQYGWLSQTITTSFKVKIANFVQIGAHNQMYSYKLNTLGLFR